jgi:shikimate 5-dehydrogenase
VLCFGAGGAAIALSVYLARRPNAGDRPTHFYVVDINPHRLDGLREIHAKLTTDIQFTYLLHTSAAQNDALLTRLPPGSVVVNATGMGKDTPGSPISDAAPFPILGFAWDMNYRGELTFLRQARQQQGERTLTVENGWVYFLHGWTQVISAVFDSPLSPALFAALDAEAVPFR